jgi:hypothetical protein
MNKLKAIQSCIIVLATFIASCAQGDSIKSKAFIRTNRDDSIFSVRLPSGSGAGILRNGDKFGTWKFYDTKNVLSNVQQYYADTILFALDKADFVYGAVKYGSSFVRLPKSWNVNHDNEKHVLICTKEVAGSSFNPTIVITKERYNQSMPFKDFTEDLLPKLRNRFSDFSLIKKYEGRDRTELLFKYLENDRPLCSILEIIKKGDEVYYIICTAANERKYDFLTYKTVFEDVCDSFE